MICPRCGAHQRDDRIVAKRNRDRQILATLLGLMQMQRDIMHRHRLQPELTLAFHFHPVNADVLLAEMVRIERIARDHTRFIKVKPAVAVV